MPLSLKHSNMQLSLPSRPPLASPNNTVQCRAYLQDRG